MAPPAHVGEPCPYCDTLLTPDGFNVLSIDRIYSDRGYEAGNVIAVCNVCNGLQREATAQLARLE